MVREDVSALVDRLNFAQKVERSLELISDAYRDYGDRMVVANSLGKDSVAVWHLAKRVSPFIRGVHREVVEAHLRHYCAVQPPSMTTSLPVT